MLSIDCSCGRSNRAGCGPDVKSATIVISARNERGSIEAAGERIPDFVADLEIMFCEGHSRDGTWQEIELVWQCRGAWP